MKLVSFSVENYRSITKARKIPLSDYSLLIGANNEGKSNILHALTLGMNALVSWKRQVSRTSDGKIIRTAPTEVRHSKYNRSYYDWKTDYPISKQKNGTKSASSNITLEFALSGDEIAEFKEEIKSNINGTLPLLITFSNTGFDVSVQKPGRGNATLNKKSVRIANFVSERIQFEYIPAIRTASSATRVISGLVERELGRLEENQDYREALEKIEALQQPIFVQLAETIQSTVSAFLPSVTSVKLNPLREARYRALRRDVEILVDDGQQTRLERKGDGVQSLVALALMRHASEHSNQDLNTVIAIEEPESHLHPRAVHELRAVIEELSEQNQIVLSSHSPLFVNAENLKNTVIVQSSKAKCAEHVSEVREALGVKFSDNLQNASLILLVEGLDDVIALTEILPHFSEKLDVALKAGTLIIDHLGGASALSQKSSFYTASACLVQAFLDNDSAGTTAVEKAVAAKSLKIADVNLCTVPHLTESEFEDLYDKSVYRDAFKNEFGVDPKLKVSGKSNLKWSAITEKQFKQSGKPWSDKIKAEVKLWLANFASDNSDCIINSKLDSPLVAFLQSAESKLPD